MAGASEVCVGVSEENVTEITVDGAIRMSKLRNALDRAANGCVSALNYSLLKAHFNPKSRDDREKLRNIHSLFQEKALANIKDEIVLMIREENVEQMLLKLDELCNLSFDSREVRWRPKGVPVDDAAAQLMPGILKLRQKVKVMIDDQDAETDRMMHAVLQRRRLIQNLKSELAENAKLLSMYSSH